MQLLGLYLYNMPMAVSKVLQKGWYPFGTYKSPKAGKLVIVENTISNWVYVCELYRGYEWSRQIFSIGYYLPHHQQLFR